MKLYLPTPIISSSSSIIYLYIQVNSNRFSPEPLMIMLLKGYPIWGDDGILSPYSLYLSVCCFTINSAVIENINSKITVMQGSIILTCSI